MKQILITKANGVMEPFNVDKLKSSLYRSGANQDQTEKVIQKITAEIKPGDSTADIYHKAFEFLKRTEKGVAARYSLRRSLADLGPSGFPFEIFISRLFESKGYMAKVGLHLKGKCIDHEVDLIASDGKLFIMGEVKFHNNSDLKNDSKTIMYVHSRYEDLKRSNFDNTNVKGLKPQGWLITNTKFTETTINYANCYGLKLLGWNFPYEGLNLQTWIEETGLEPVTILTTLNADEKKMLLKKKVVLCDYLQKHPEVLTEIGLDSKRVKEVLAELEKLCQCRPSTSTA